MLQLKLSSIKVDHSSMEIYAWLTLLLLTTKYTEMHHCQEQIKECTMMKLEYILI